MFTIMMIGLISVIIGIIIVAIAIVGLALSLIGPIFSGLVTIGTTVLAVILIIHIIEKVQNMWRNHLK